MPISLVSNSLSFASFLSIALRQARCEQSSHNSCFSSLVSKERNESSDCNRRSVWHLARPGIIKHQFRMRAQPALLHAEKHFARAAEQFAKKSAAGGPNEDHHAPGDARQDQREHKLRWSYPGSDGGTQLHIAHSHAAHQAKNSKKQTPQSPASKTVSNPAPPMQPARDRHPRDHEREDQPVRDAAAAQVSERRDDENNQRWPPGD